jgi:hypothetical protein
MKAFEKLQELDTFKKQQRESETDGTSKELRLNRALEELEKLKGQHSRTIGESKEKIESLQKNTDRLFQDNKKLQKQKLELLAVFKKQNQLIDVLKRQKIHLEAAALLGFSEEEFVRALNCRPNV